MKLLVLAGVAAVVTVGAYIGYNIKGESILVSTRYEMLACEDCYHLHVNSSQDKVLVGTTIIPQSGLVDIEEMIGKAAISKEALCLRGKPYRFNFNLLGIKPDGTRFEVVSIESPTTCSKF